MQQSSVSFNALDLLNKVYNTFVKGDLKEDDDSKLPSLINVLPSLQQILDSLNYGIVIINQSHEIIYYNNELLLILELQGPLIGKKWQDVFKFEIPKEIKRVAKEASFNYPTYHNLKIVKENKTLTYSCSLYPVEDALLVQLNPSENLGKIQNDFSLDYIQSIGENNPLFEQEILKSFIQVVSEDIEKIKFCFKDTNDCAKFSLIAQNIASNINLLGREDLVNRWTSFIQKGLDKMEDKYELIILIKLTENLVQSVKYYIAGYNL